MCFHSFLLLLTCTLFNCSACGNITLILTIATYIFLLEEFPIHRIIEFLLSWHELIHIFFVELGNFCFLKLHWHFFIVSLSNNCCSLSNQKQSLCHKGTMCWKKMNMINWKQVSVIMSQEKLCPLGKRITAVNATLELFCRWVILFFIFICSKDCSEYIPFGK